MGIGYSKQMKNWYFGCKILLVHKIHTFVDDQLVAIFGLVQTRNAIITSLGQLKTNVLPEIIYYFIYGL